MKLSQKEGKPCSSCEKLTKYMCADCAIDIGKFIPVCEDSKCRDKHELEVHYREKENASR